jgi:hypothetical protein
MRNNAAVPGDEDAVSFFDAIEKFAKVGFRFKRPEAGFEIYH